MTSGLKTSHVGATVIIGCLFVFGMFFFSGRKTERTSFASIGSITAIVGDVDVRLPGSMNFERAKSGVPLLNGEQIFAHEAAQVTLTFNGGASVRLQPGARFVAEKDSLRGGDGVLATLLEGDADLLVAGSHFRLMKNGRDITQTGSHGGEADQVVVGTAGRVFPAGSTRLAGSPSVVTASTPAETPAPTAHASSNSRSGLAASSDDETGNTDSKDSLSNDEIRRTMASEIGFYRRCYLTYLNRAHVDATNVRAASVTVGFTIANTGKVHDARVVRSDFNDSTLNACVLETVERTPFRAFKASDIPVLEFPIELK